MINSQFSTQWIIPWWGFEGPYRTDGFAQDIPGTGRNNPEHEASPAAGGPKFNYKRLRENLNSFRKEAQSRPKLNGYPPAVYISYRWENPRAKHWVRQLADYIHARGFKVFLDQDYLVEDCRMDDYRVSKFVAKLAESHIGLFVLTDAYIESEARIWLTEENQVGALEAWHGRLIPILLFKSLVEIPKRWWHPIKLNFLANEGDFSPLDPYLAYNGIRLAEIEEEEIRALLLEVEAKLRHGEHGEAERLLEKKPFYASIPECRLSLAMALGGQGRTHEALDLANGLIPELEKPGAQPEFRLNLIFLFKALGEFECALQIALPMRFTAGGFRGPVYALIADILDDCGALQSSVNHSLCALQLTSQFSHLQQVKGPILGDLGRTLLRLGEYRVACIYLRDAVRLMPEDPNPTLNLLIALANSGKAEEFAATARKALEQFGHDKRIYGAIAQGEQNLQIGSIMGHFALDLGLPCIQCAKCGSYFETFLPNQQACSNCGEYSGGHPQCQFCGAIKFFPLDLSETKDPEVKCPTCGSGPIQTAQPRDPLLGFERLGSLHESLIEEIVVSRAQGKALGEEDLRRLVPQGREDLADAIKIFGTGTATDHPLIETLGLEAAIFARRLRQGLIDPGAYLKKKEQALQAIRAALRNFDPSTWRYKHSGEWTGNVIFNVAFAVQDPDSHPRLLNALDGLERDGKKKFADAVRQILAGERDIQKFANLEKRDALIIEDILMKVAGKTSFTIEADYSIAEEEEHAALSQIEPLPTYRWPYEQEFIKTDKALSGLGFTFEGTFCAIGLRHSAVGLFTKRDDSAYVQYRQIKGSETAASDQSEDPQLQVQLVFCCDYVDGTSFQQDNSFYSATPDLTALSTWYRKFLGSRPSKPLQPTDRGAIVKRWQGIRYRRD